MINAGSNNNNNNNNTNNNNNNSNNNNIINDTCTVCAISFETLIAGAIEGLVGVSTSGVHVTVVTVQLAFVDKDLWRKKNSSYVSADLRFMFLKCVVFYVVYP